MSAHPAATLGRPGLAVVLVGEDPASAVYVRNKQRQFQHDGRHEGLATLTALGPLENMRTFWDFDGRVTAPLHGFSDAADYYRRASSRYFLGEISTPTLVIQACDGPISSARSLVILPLSTVSTHTLSRV